MRAMEIIDQLEPIKRGVYGGAVVIGRGMAIWILRLLRTAVIKTVNCMCRRGRHRSRLTARAGVGRN